MIYNVHFVITKKGRFWESGRDIWTSSYFDANKYSDPEDAEQDIRENGLLKEGAKVSQVTIEIDDLNSNTLSIKESKRKSFKENHVSNSEFVSNTVDQFLKDVAQYSGLFGYNDIIDFEKIIINPNDKNLRKIKQLKRRIEELAEEDDEDLIEHHYQNVADIVLGVVDYNE